MKKSKEIKYPREKENYIISEIEIKEKDINKDIRIINYFEEVKRNNEWKDQSLMNLIIIFQIVKNILID